MSLSLSTSQLPSVGGQQGKEMVPVPLSTQYGFTPQNMPLVQCHFHPSETIRYFCKEALMPLCAECVAGHKEEQYELGRRTNIVPLEATLTEVYSKISSQANEIAQNYDKLIEANDYSHVQSIEKSLNYKDVGDKQSLLTNPVQLIDSARQQVHSIVDNYFNTLVTFIRARIPENLQRAPDVQREIYDLKSSWDHVVQDLELLNSQSCLQQLIHYYQGDITQQNDKVLNQAKNTLLQLKNSIQQLPMGLSIPQLTVDPLYLQKFLQALERYAYFFEPPFEPYIQQRDPNFMQQAPPQFAYPRDPYYDDFMQQPPLNSQYYSPDQFQRRLPNQRPHEYYETAPQETQPRSAKKPKKVKTPKPPIIVRQFNGPTASQIDQSRDLQYRQPLNNQPIQYPNNNLYQNPQYQNPNNLNRPYR